MKFLAIGILLLIYAMFLTPAYLEPWDLVLSTAYITTFTSMGIPVWLILTWIISGYVAFGIALFLHVHFAFRIKHPIVVGVIIALIAVIVGYWAYVNMVD